MCLLNPSRLKDRTLMHLLRCMFFIVAHHNVWIHAFNLPGAQNTVADALSRNRILEYLQVVPEAERYPTAIPQGLINPTVRKQPDCAPLVSGPNCSATIAVKPMQCSRNKFLSFCIIGSAATWYVCLFCCWWNRSVLDCVSIWLWGLVYCLPQCL